MLFRHRCSPPRSLPRSAAGLLRLLCRQGRRQAFQRGFAGDPGPRRRSHRDQHAQRLPGRADRLRAGRAGARGACRRARSTSATRRSSSASTPTAHRGSRSTSIPIHVRRAIPRRDAMNAELRPMLAPSGQAKQSASQALGRHRRSALHRRRIRHRDPLGDAVERARNLAPAKTAIASPPAPARHCSPTCGRGSSSSSPR